VLTAARRRGDVPASDKAPPRLSGKPEILEEENRIDRERVVELDDIDVARPEPGHRIGLSARLERPGHGQVGHARNIGVGDRRANAEHINRRLFEPLARSGASAHRAAAIRGRQSRARERIADHAGA